MDKETEEEKWPKTQVVNKMIVKASMDTIGCYRAKKCTEVVSRKGNMITREGYTVLEEQFDALNPNKRPRP